MPHLSVIIPLRNRSGTRLANCLRSLRWQGLPASDVEIVLSDFGSDETHLSSVRSLAAEYGAVVEATVTAEVWNRSRALNIGLQAATGILAMCTDADMIFAPDFLQTAVALHAEEGDAMVVSRCYDLPQSVPEQRYEHADFERLFAAATERSLSGTGACQLARRAFFETVRGYDEAFKYWGAEDDDMLHRAGRFGLHVRVVPDTTSMLHQWHPTMKNDRKLQRKLNEWRYKLTRHRVVKNQRGWGKRGRER